MEEIIFSENLTKQYNNKVVVGNLNLVINKGEIYGLLGPNGAGKSTIILMLLGLTEPSGGFVKVAGFDSTREPLKVKSITGYLPEKIGFYEDMTAAENLAYTARLNNIQNDQIPSRIDDALKLVKLDKNRNQLVKQFSKGMKQRLGIADVLIKEPQLVIFDELTEGLDVKVANSILETIVDLNKNKGITFLISSHQLNLIQKICHRVGIMSKGKLVGEGKIDEMGRKLFGEGRYLIDLEASPITDQLIEKIKKLNNIINLDLDGNKIKLTCDQDLRSEISKIIANSGSILTTMNIKDYALEEIYLNYFKEE